MWWAINDWSSVLYPLVRATSVPLGVNCTFSFGTWLFVEANYLIKEYISALPMSKIAIYPWHGRHWALTTIQITNVLISQPFIWLFSWNNGNMKSCRTNRIHSSSAHINWPFSSFGIFNFGSIYHRSDHCSPASINCIAAVCMRIIITSEVRKLPSKIFPFELSDAQIDYKKPIKTLKPTTNKLNNYLLDFFEFFGNQYSPRKDIISAYYGKLLKRNYASDSDTDNWE